MKTDYELLSHDLGGIKLSEATTITFLGWVAKKLNNLTQSSPTANELTTLISRPSLGKMQDGAKIEIIRKLEKLGITI